MVSYEEALKCVVEALSGIELTAETVALENSTGRILSENIISDVDLPAFTYSAMDGYGVLLSNRTTWKVIGEIVTGADITLNPGQDEAVQLFTGSRVPECVDTVIPNEQITLRGNEINLNEGFILKKGANIREKGSDLVKDKIALRRYTKIEPKTISVLAACGISAVPVFKKPKAGILGTGNELIPVAQTPTGDKIRASNIYALYSAVAGCGLEPILFGYTKDNKDEIRNTLKRALDSDIDILITTGGISAGKYDYLKDLYDELGVDIRFRKVNIKPGKPNIFGIHKAKSKKKYIFGLPGNPVSSLVGFYIFIRPAIEALYMQKNINRLFAYLDTDISKKDNKLHFIRGEVYYDGDKLKVKPGYSQSSGNFIELSKSNCLIEIPEHLTGFVRGDIVKCIMI